MNCRLQRWGVHVEHPWSGRECWGHLGAEEGYLGALGQGRVFVEWSSGWFPPTTQACPLDATRPIRERGPEMGGWKLGGQRASGSWYLGETDVSGQRLESCWVGEQDKIPGRGKSKAGSRSL